EYENLFLKELKNWNRQGIDLGLSRMKNLLEFLGNPEKSLQVIHVGGTNGKGSVCNYLKSILVEGGYRVGVYSSPNINGYNDGIKINDEYISYQKLYETLNFVKQTWESNYFGEDYITFFEAMTAAMLLYFKDNEVDYAVIEVGLGGKNDATNIFENKLLSVITSISLDHTGILGNSIEEIAFEKAGIIQEQDNVVAYPSSEKSLEVIEKVCNSKKADFFKLDFDDINIIKEDTNISIFNYKNYKNIELGMLGRHQIYNASLALLAIDNLLNRNLVKLSKENIRKGIRNSALPGRLELISSNPKIILDGAHNDDAVDYLVNFFKNKKYKNLRIVIGVLKDKSHKNIFRKISKLSASFYLTEVPFEGREMTVDDMSEELKEFTSDVRTYRNPKDALNKAIKNYEEDDIILVTGSLYLISELRKYIKEKYNNN
ncbi:bifunctional folylpolyglutamate synthase/dihydrofolate synthase, partial [Peptostreptococcaceae bacterium OttesenSCG-928-C18]|nr:bifunctional folylpolyglutamate synthase/dihydrofolate synthase [Peptostreptococcaceae bacterium OttesenSCG-928-C18]